MSKVDIIIPVYKGYEETKNCLQSVLNGSLGQCANIIVINDCSPDAKLTDYLQSVPGITYIYHDKNLGFVRTVNEGLMLSIENDVVILNSDTIVYNDWLDRLKKCAYSDEKIATVTPISNNATLCSFPKPFADNEQFEYSGQDIDAAAAKLPFDGAVETPTGVGFCMYIKRAVIDDIGVLDAEKFGRGYGEENDFCQRAIKQGWKNIITPNVYVKHVGSVSFGLEKKALSQLGDKIVQKTHRNYVLDVRNFVREDSLAVSRAAICLQMLADSSKIKLLFVSHDLGGGVHHHTAELEKLLADRAEIVYLQPVSANQVKLCWKPKVTGFQLVYDVSTQYDALVSMLHKMNICALHYHHTYGLPLEIFKLSGALKIPYDITLHDYHLINGSATLANKQGDFVGLDKLLGGEAKAYGCPSAELRKKNRDAYAVLLSNARRVFSPSLATKEIYEKIYSNLPYVVLSHPDDENWRPAIKPSYDSSQKLRVVYIGAFAKHKGEDLFESTAMLCSNIDFYVMGHTSRRLKKTIKVTGKFHADQISQYIASIRPHVVWFPCRCPEVYCYALSDALRLCLPIIAPDIGAFPERLQNREYAIMYPWQQNAIECAEMFNKIASHWDDDLFWKHSSFGDKVGAANKGSDYYSNTYIDVNTLSKKTSESFRYAEIDAALVVIRDDISSIKKRVVRQLLKLRFIPGVNKIESMVPVWFKSQLYRLLLS